ncbi:MAG TPA: hypothetical protein VN901_23655 [Candidatus Acidoferrales bacterium]|nr:hypothetical protein [Candidatus Acidoferrales bacterium]
MNDMDDDAFADARSSSAATQVEVQEPKVVWAPYPKRNGKTCGCMIVGF